MAVGSLSVLAALSRAVAEESEGRKAGISAASANATRGAMDSTAKDEVALGQDYGRQREQAGLEMSGPFSQQEQGIRAETMRRSTPNSDSTDELMNYAKLKAMRRLWGSGDMPALQGDEETPRALSTPGQARPQHSPEKTAQLAELTQAGNTTAADIMAGDGGDDAFNSSVDSFADAYTDVAGGAYTPEMREKERRLAELDRAGASTIAQINGQQAPGVNAALTDTLEARKNEIVSQLAAPPAVMPQLQQPPPQVVAQQPQPQPGMVPQGTGRPVASFPMVAAAPPQPQQPLVPPVVYPPSPAYPQPMQPNTQELDAAANYARFRLGQGR